MQHTKTTINYMEIVSIMQNPWLFATFFVVLHETVNRISVTKCSCCLQAYILCTEIGHSIALKPNMACNVIIFILDWKVERSWVNLLVLTGVVQTCHYVETKEMSKQKLCNFTTKIMFPYPSSSWLVWVMTLKGIVQFL